MGEKLKEEEMPVSDKEVIYYTLCGTCGRQFLQSIVNIGKAEEIYEANSWIKENFRNSFTVKDLAEERNMSVSLFHQKFKSAVGMGPLQCQKRLRLTEARRLMLDENKNVTEVSASVGYESVSQFIRDYRKMFGWCLALHLCRERHIHLPLHSVKQKMSPLLQPRALHLWLFRQVIQELP